MPRDPVGLEDMAMGSAAVGIFGLAALVVGLTFGAVLRGMGVRKMTPKTWLAFLIVAAVMCAVALPLIAQANGGHF